MGEYAERPAGVWAAPGRVNLIGEHTDYNDGFVLPFALPQRTVVAAAPERGRRWTVWSEQAGERISFGRADAAEPGRVTGWGAYVAGVVWALREAGHDVPVARLAIASDVPLGAGLSSSAALESAVLTALADLGELDLPLADRPALAQRAENGYAGMPCGIMDQSASLRCQPGHALFLDCRTLAVEQVPFDLDAAGLAILVIDSNAPHRHVGGEYAARRAACESAAGTLGVPALRDVTVDRLDAALARLDDETVRRRVRHVVTENQRVRQTVELLRAGRLAEIGPLLTASHTSMRDDFEITVPEVDTAVEAALTAGAYGARMTGGGFGGCVLALVDAAAAEAVASAVTEAYAARGFRAPSSFTVTPGPGAVRLG
ncbi:galactokinase [Plantactinospora sp. KLBMP9567]|uniref:galactokinase n=1 Tax=Plantactinospora sp. KLBMP9567 TaxID=3085900 RepID=UPI0029813835|nr:galactokinase [Plantactinospora sp. KLBMP9567]MDW5326420.1 galactokinase [Plantactinospora sp. KLBMP9567]